MVRTMARGLADVAAVRAVIFDLDDTLINWRQAEAGAMRAIVQAHLVPLDCAAPMAEATYAEIMEENFRAFRVNRQWWYIHDRLRLLIERVGLADRLPVEVLAGAFKLESAKRLALLPGALAALRAARAGRRTALLTNGPAHVQRPKVETFGLVGEVDFVGISGELGHWKPDAEAFHEVLKRLGVAPEEALMVGDSLDFDITPAKALGMRTAWVTHGGGASVDADISVANPAGLVEHLGPPRRDSAAHNG